MESCQGVNCGKMLIQPAGKKKADVQYRLMVLQVRFSELSVFAVGRLFLVNWPNQGLSNRPAAYSLFFPWRIPPFSLSLVAMLSSGNDVIAGSIDGDILLYRHLF